MELTAAQCRMARAGLEVSVRDLAKLADVAPNTVSRFENGREGNTLTRRAIRTALEGLGAEFTNGDAPGVRLRQRAADVGSSPA